MIGYILAPIFSLDSWWLVILYATVMMGVASLEAVSRPAASYKVSGVSWQISCYQHDRMHAAITCSPGVRAWDLLGQSTGTLWLHAHRECCCMSWPCWAGRRRS